MANAKKFYNSDMIIKDENIKCNLNNMSAAHSNNLCNFVAKEFHSPKIKSKCIRKCCCHFISHERKITHKYI